MLKAVLLALALLLLPACAAYQPLQIVPVKKTAPIAPKFSQSFYYLDRDQTLHFILRSASTDAASGKPIQQIATIRLFWQPRGGITTLDPSAINATFRYIVMTPDAVGMYEGSGFVRLQKNLKNDPPATLNARVLDADLRLTQASKSFNDTIGRAHLNGFFTATYSDTQTVDMLLSAQREFFAKSLTTPAVPAPPSSAPATSPG